ncbi:hypothetical protein [Thiomonas sp.]
MKTDAEIDTLPEAHAEIVRYVEAGYRITCHPGILPALPIPAAVAAFASHYPAPASPPALWITTLSVHAAKTGSKTGAILKRKHPMKSWD